MIPSTFLSRSSGRLTRASLHSGTKISGLVSRLSSFELGQKEELKTGDDASTCLPSEKDRSMTVAVGVKEIARDDVSVSLCAWGVQ